MTKTQYKSKLRKLEEKLYILLDELREVEDDMNYDKDEIESLDSITSKQEERAEWLDNTIYYVSELREAIEENLNELEYGVEL